MPFDIAVVDADQRIVLFVEVDGSQHFCGAHIWHDRGIAERDLMKEQAAVAAGIPIARVYQPDVWNGTFDWKAFLSVIVEKACSGNLRGVHCQPGCEMYMEGVYASLRR